MSLQELTSSLAIDTSEFVNPITAAAASVSEFSKSATESIETVTDSMTKSIDTGSKYSDMHAKSSKSAENAIVKSHKGIISSTLNWTGTMSIAAAIMGKFDPKFKKYALGLGLVSLSHKLYKSAVEASTASTRAMQRAVESVSNAKPVKPPKADDHGNMLSGISEAANIMGRRALFATVAYKAGLDEVGTAMSKHVALDSAMMKAIGGVASSFSNATTTGIDMFSEGIKGSLLAALQFTTGFESLTDVVDAGANTITGFAKTAQQGMDYVKDSARDAGLAFGTFLASVQSWGTLDSKSFYEEGQALNEMAEATKRVTESQMAMKDALSVVNGAVASGENGRKLALEQVRISQIATVEGIDKEIQKIREQTAATDKAITKTKEWKKYTTDLVGALEKQRTHIMGEGLKEPKEEKKEEKSDAAKAYDTALEGLNRLKYGQEEAARMAIQASNATDEEVIALLGLHDATVKLKDEQDQLKHDNDLYEKGAEKIEAMKDELDKLTGAASNAEIETRKLARAGYAQEQIDEIGRLQEKIDGLNQKKQAGGGGKENKAVYAGSSESASIAFRGLGGKPKKNSKVEQIAQSQLTVQQQLLAATKANKSHSQTLVAGNISGY